MEDARPLISQRIGGHRCASVPAGTQRTISVLGEIGPGQSLVIEDLDRAPAEPELTQIPEKTQDPRDVLPVGAHLGGQVLVGRADLAKTGGSDPQVQGLLWAALTVVGTGALAWTASRWVAPQQAAYF